MNRGDVWWVDCPNIDLLGAGEIAAGGEIRKRRPAVIVSNDSANRHLNRVQVVPLTNRIDRLYPGEAYVLLNGTQNKALANQLTTVSKARLVSLVGRLSRDDMQAVELGIKVQLGLPI